MTISAFMPALDRAWPVPYGHRSPSALRFRRKFERFFPEGFQDRSYLDRERARKWKAHERWAEELAPARFRSLLKNGRFDEICRRAIGIGSGSGLLAPQEKTALMDAARPPAAAQRFAAGLWEFVQASPGAETFERWSGTLESLPWREGGGPTWPVATVFGFIARPDQHLILKPVVTRVAAREYGFDFWYHSQPNSRTYLSLHEFAATILLDLRDLGPSDMIDIHSFIWVQGAGEYEE